VNEENIDYVMGDLKSQLGEMLRQTIRPEFLNRIDEIVLFKPLLKSELKGIVDIQLQRVAKMLADKNITMEVKDEVKDFIINLGYDVTYGARPLKRTIQKYITNPLATELLMNNFSTGDTVVMSYDGSGRVLFSKK
jgi:ATP-dependent Clp protease ATP-binding subunit ClpB